MGLVAFALCLSWIKDLGGHLSVTEHCSRLKITASDYAAARMLYYDSDTRLLSARKEILNLEGCGDRALNIEKFEIPRDPQHVYLIFTVASGRNPIAHHPRFQAQPNVDEHAQGEANF